MIVPISNTTNLLVKRKKKSKSKEEKKESWPTYRRRTAQPMRSEDEIEIKSPMSFSMTSFFFLPRFFFFAVFPSFFLRSATLSLATRWSLGFGFFLFAINFRDAIFLRGVSFSFWRFFWGFFFLLTLRSAAFSNIRFVGRRWSIFRRRFTDAFVLFRGRTFSLILLVSLSLFLYWTCGYITKQKKIGNHCFFFNAISMNPQWSLLHGFVWSKSTRSVDENKKKIQTLKTKTVKKKKCFQIDPFLFSSGPLVHWLTSEGNLRAATSSRQVFFSSSPPKPIDR